MSGFDAAARGIAATGRIRATRLALLDKLERAAAKASLSNPRNAGLASGVTVTDRLGTFPSECATATLQAPATSANLRHIGGTFLASGSASQVYSARIAATGGNFGTNDGKQVSYWRTATMHTGRYLAVRLGAVSYVHRFLVDGKYISTSGTVLTTTSGSTNQYILFDFGSRGTRRFEYEGQPGCVLVGFYTEASGRFYAPPADRPKIAWLGDSYVGGASATNRGDELPVVTGDWLGAEMLASGAGGTGWATSSGYRFDQRIANGDLALGGTPDVIFLMASTNDYQLSNATTQANARTGLQAARALYPDVPIVVFGCSAMNTGPSTAITDNENAVAAAVTAFADPLCKFVPVSTDSAGSWVTGTGYASSGSTTGNAYWTMAGNLGHFSDEGCAAQGRLYAQGALTALRTMLAA